MKRTTIIEAISVLYVILFLYTGISKIMDYSVFKEQLASSPILSPVAGAVAIGLPLTEFVVVVLLVVPRWRLKGLYASAALMLAFTLYILGILSFSEKLPCSCGGIIALMSWKQHLVFNSVFLGLAIWAIVLEKQLKRDHKIEWRSAGQSGLGTIA